MEINLEVSTKRHKKIELIRNKTVFIFPVITKAHDCFQETLKKVLGNNWQVNYSITIFFFQKFWILNFRNITHTYLGLT